jgi:hypothetical protein
MNTIKQDTSLLAVVSPSSYLTICAEPENNQNFSMVPLQTLHGVFHKYGRFGREHLVRTFLAKASDDDRVKAILRSDNERGEKVPPGYDAWESWLKTKTHADEVSFAPIPGFGATVQVEYLGDAYRWSTHDAQDGNKRAGGSFLRSLIEACIKDEERDSHFEGPPTPVKDIEIFFTLPTNEESQYVVLDVGVLASIIRSVFKIKVNVRSLTQSLANSFSSGSFHDRAALSDGNDERGLAVQCTLTGRNAYTNAEIEDMTTRNNRSWEKYVITGCSFDSLPRRAALRKVVGSKIYFDRSVGSGYPPEIRLRIYTSYRQVKTVQPLGVYAQQELLRNNLLPKFALAIARLHRPDLFA